MTKELDFLLSRIKKNKESSSSPTPTHTNSIEQFLSEYNIVQGIDRVPNGVLYYLYDNMKHTHFKLSKIEFFRKLSKQFETKRNGNQRFYMISLKDLKVENYQELVIKLKHEKLLKWTKDL